MTHLRFQPLVLILLAINIAGCAKDNLPPLPTHPLVDETQTLELIRQRTASITNLTGKGSVALSSPTRGDITLESVFVLRPPGDARVRAWKFNQAVFDLAVLNDGVWLYSPREKPGQTGEIGAAGKTLGDSVRQWIGLLLGKLDAPDATKRIDGDTLVVTRPAAGGGTLTITIDRPTLTVRSQSISDEAGVKRFGLSFERYQFLGNTLWPTRIVATSPTGTITIRTDSLTLNDAPDSAFKPSPRAIKLP